MAIIDRDNLHAFILFLTAFIGISGSMLSRGSEDKDV